MGFKAATFIDIYKYMSVCVCGIVCVDYRVSVSLDNVLEVIHRFAVDLSTSVCIDGE
jgi:hypothetical protein